MFSMFALLAAGGDEAGAHHVLWGVGLTKGGAPGSHSGSPHRHLRTHAGKGRLQHPDGAIAADAGAERRPV